MGRINNGKGFQNDIDMIERLDALAARGPIGQVRFASGNRVTTNLRRMDWALVELDPKLPVQNLLPTRDQFSRQSFGATTGYKIQEGATVSGTNDLLKATWYGKVGRNSESTGAERSRILRTVAWDNGLISDEYEFISLDSCGQFARGGDSGSLVFNLQKEWVGMLFAMDRSTRCGFITPAYELMRDIEETTGGTITLA